MLIPVRQLYPIRLAPTESRTITLETNLPVSPILHPKIFFRNTSTSDPFRASLSHVLALGVSDDPLLAGNFATVMFDQTVGPSELLWHVFPAVFLGEGLVYHELTIETAGASDDVIVQMWIEGQFEETLRVLPTFQPIVV